VIKKLTPADTLTVNGIAVSALDLARARQQLAHEGCYLPQWEELSQHDQEMAALSAAGWLRSLGNIAATGETPLVNEDERALTAAAALTPDDPRLPSPPQSQVVMTWDHKEQPDLDALAAIVAAVSGGMVHLHPVRYRTEDKDALVITDRKLTADEILAAYREAFSG
jgi:hypothetical protein